MSLLSVDIIKNRKLSLKEIDLPAKEPEIKLEAILPKNIELPPTDEEIAYSRLLLINPLIEKLVDSLDLVSSITGEKIRKVKLPKELIPEVKPKVDRDKLLSLANKILKEEESYSKDEILKRIKEALKINQERADKGFILMLESGVIERTLNPDLYYLGGSTPF